MTRFIEGSHDADGLHIGIAVASWNQAVTDRLLDGAVRRAKELGAAEVTVLRVPGALEIPIAARALALSGCDAIVALGTVIKGDTDHYEIVVKESAAGISAVALETARPVANAILAVRDYAHAVERSAEGDANAGVQAVNAAVTTATALRQLGEA